MGTVELCVIHGGGQNVPPVLDATFSGYEYSKYNKVLIIMLYPLITIDDDIIFNTTIFTLASGERLCFNVTIVDDNVTEYDEDHHFYFYALNNSIPVYQFLDQTEITIRDNEDTEGQKLFKTNL